MAIVIFAIAVSGLVSEAMRKEFRDKDRPRNGGWQAALLLGLSGPVRAHGRGGMGHGGMGGSMAAGYSPGLYPGVPAFSW